MMHRTLLLLALVPSPAVASACFHTAAEAALQAGVRDGEGFLLEGIRIDPLGGGRWATVRSCIHPERPGVAVRVGNAAVERVLAGPSAVPAALAAVSVIAPGDTVEATQADANVKLVMSAVAQSGGAIGDTIRVRLAPLGGSGEARFARAIIRTPNTVELEAAQ